MAKPVHLLLITCALSTEIMIGFGHDNRQSGEGTHTQHIGEQLFYALFGVEKLPVCVLCDEEDQHSQQISQSFLDSDLFFTLSVALCCFVMLLLCSALLIIFVCRQKASKDKVSVKNRSISAKRKVPLKPGLFSTKEPASGGTAKAIRHHRLSYSPKTKRIRLMVRKKRNGTVQTLGLCVDNFGDTNKIQCLEERREKRSKRSLEEDEPSTEDTSEQLDALLCVKPNCQDHYHRKKAVVTKTRKTGGLVSSQNDSTGHVSSKHSDDTSVREDDSDWVFDLGTPQHSSTFVQSDSQSFIRCNQNGSSVDPFANRSSCDNLGSLDEPRIPSYKFTYYNSTLSPPFIAEPIPVDPEKFCDEILERSWQMQEICPTNSDESSSLLDTSLDQSMTISSFLSDDSSNLESSVDSTTSGLSFLNSFQNFANSSRLSIRSVLERTTSSVRDLAVQTGRGARYVGQKTAEGAGRLRQKTGNGTRIVFAKTADGVHYVIECARSGRRCVVRKICAAEKSLLCAIARENLDWSVHDYMREFACYGDEMNTAVHLVAAVLVKSSLDKARSYAQRHLDTEQSSPADDTSVWSRDSDSLNLNAAFSEELRISTELCRHYS